MYAAVLKSIFKQFQTVLSECHKHSPQHLVRIHLNHVLPAEILILEDFHASLVVCLSVFVKKSR